MTSGIPQLVSCLRDRSTGLFCVNAPHNEWDELTWASAFDAESLSVQVNRILCAGHTDLSNFETVDFIVTEQEDDSGTKHLTYKEGRTTVWTPNIVKKTLISYDEELDDLAQLQGMVETFHVPPFRHVILMLDRFDISQVAGNTISYTQHNRFAFSESDDLVPLLLLHGARIMYDTTELVATETKIQARIKELSEKAQSYFPKEKPC